MFNKILVLAEKNGFIKKTILPRLNLNQFRIGPTGLLLQENLKSEWFNNIVVNKDITVFLNDNNISETYDYAKEMCLEKLPFGIAEILQNKSPSSSKLMDYCNNRPKDENIVFDHFFLNNSITLKCSILVSPNHSTPVFHQWQRQRRMWWRKFSASPGRYSLTDIKNDDASTQSVEILAKYPWGSQLIEKLIYDTTDKNFTGPQLQFKDGKKIIKAHSIRSVIKLSTMFLNSICDAFDEPLFQGEPRGLLRFHRKLAPYKISFSVTGSNVAAVTELCDLALYLCKQLRTNHISTLFLPSSWKHTLEAQYNQYDTLGIPYNVILNENTLKNGIAQLRSRDTTLKEQVHVTNLVTYVEQLFKNY